MIQHRPQTLITRCLLLLTLGSLPLALAFGQSSTATLSGTVTDPNGAVVPGVKVTVTDPATRLQRDATTNESGQFVVPLLPPSTYDLTLERAGFMTAAINDVVLNVNDNRALGIQMKVGDVNETVNVTGEASLISESPAVGTVVDRQFVGNLPLNGRSFQSLITLAPGVVTTSVNAANKGQFSVNGQRTTANYFTVDGVSANFGANTGDGLAADIAGALPGLNTFGGTGSLVSVDALQEFKIQTSSFAPEFGRTPGGQVQILTRSGTNSFHGTAFEYFRNDALDARDWFVNANRLAKPALREHDFGFVLGGPVLLPRLGESGSALGYNGHNRTFFFFSYEGLRLRQPQTVNRVIVAQRLRQNAPAAFRPILNAFPLPTGPEVGTTGQAPYAASFSNPSSLDATSLRIDHTLNPRMTLFGRYNHAPSKTITRNLAQLNRTALGTQTLTLGLTHSISNRVNNEMRFNYSRVRGQTVNGLDGFGGAVPFDLSLVVPAAYLDRRAALSITLNPALGQLALGTFNDNLQRQINLIDNLSYITGEHQLKFGVDYRRLMPIYNPREYSQQAIFGNATAIESGRATTAATFAIKSSGPIFNNFSAYGQDTWKVSQRLTLTYGLRWDVNPAPSEANGNLPFALTGIQSKATIALAPRGQRLYQTTFNNFAPRFGGAYHLWGDRGRELLIRGGVGLFYDLGSGQSAEAFTRYPFATNFAIVSGQLYPLTATQAALPSFNPPPPFSINGFSPALKLPYTWQWNFALEQSLGSNQVFNATYVGAAGRRLLRTQIMISPNPTFSQVVYTDNGNTSDYHALQMQFHRRLSRGLQALVSYTWAHAIDEKSNEGAETNPAAVRGNSDFDIRHGFSAAVAYNIPTPKLGGVVRSILHNWATDVIVRLQSAPPFNVVSGSETDAFGLISARRVNVTPGIPIYVSDPNAPGGWRLNNAVDPNRPGCKGPFCPAPAGKQGNLGRNVLRGFPLSQVDLSVRREFRLGERANLQFKVEAFNVFNHPNFAAPESSLTSVLFGQSTRMLGQSLSSGTSAGTGLTQIFQLGGPRSVQFALRLSF